MRNFLDVDFLLETETAKTLYHEYAAGMPIFDYHCHLNPKEIWENKTYGNLTEIWLYGDHYKWRALRANGVDERLITGSADDWGKYLAFAKTLPYAIGNPLYHWTHLELQRFFGIEEILNEKSAGAIWEQANRKLNQPDFACRELIKRSNVKVICTTDDPVDSLEYHLKISELEDFDVKVLPTFRPDKGLNIHLQGFAEWVDRLGMSCGRTIVDYNDFLEALGERIKFFHRCGCRISDHALDDVPFAYVTFEEAADIYTKATLGEPVTPLESSKYRTFTLMYLGRLYTKYDWAMQLHIAALRNNNTKMLNILGQDTGFDSINDNAIAGSLSRLLDALHMDDALPRTILYTLNPKDNYVLAAMTGNFQDARTSGSIQFGSAWWFNDQKDGMEEQMKALANLGLLSRFVGMLTDSRSFLSYPRHEYFRRILCNLIGGWVEKGEYPRDFEILGEITRGICYNNACNYFKL